MTQIDAEAMNELRAALQGRLDRADLHRRNGPLFEAMQQRLHATITKITPALMADPRADVRKSIFNLEKSQAEFPEKLARVDVENAAKLQRIRARTAMLRSWLEALS